MNVRPLSILIALALAINLVAGHGHATAKGPLKLTVEATKRIYSSREGVMVKFVFKARERMKLCLEKDILSQLQVSLSKSGVGKMPLAPLVLQDNRELFNQRMKVVWLEPGESTMFRANLKRLKFANGEAWTPAEYHVHATFNLCEQTPGETYDPASKDTPVPAENSGWFMIMN